MGGHQRHNQGSPPQEALRAHPRGGHSSVTHFPSFSWSPRSSSLRPWASEPTFLEPRWGQKGSRHAPCASSLARTVVSPPRLTATCSDFVPRRGEPPNPRPQPPRSDHLELEPEPRRGRTHAQEQGAGGAGHEAGLRVGFTAGAGVWRPPDAAPEPQQALRKVGHLAERYPGHSQDLSKGFLPETSWEAWASRSTSLRSMEQGWIMNRTWARVSASIWGS